jgi:hypothetical protein
VLEFLGVLGDVAGQRRERFSSSAMLGVTHFSGDGETWVSEVVQNPNRNVL